MLATDEPSGALQAEGGFFLIAARLLAGRQALLALTGIVERLRAIGPESLPSGRAGTP